MDNGLVFSKFYLQCILLWNLYELQSYLGVKGKEGRQGEQLRESPLHAPTVLLGQRVGRPCLYNVCRYNACCANGQEMNLSVTTHSYAGTLYQ
jgi:hypothetical protein